MYLNKDVILSRIERRLGADNLQDQKTGSKFVLGDGVVAIVTEIVDAINDAYDAGEEAEGK